MNEDAFRKVFADLTGNSKGHFPWQWALYQRFISDGPDNIPAACNLPTGLGKTSVLAVWLIALAGAPDKVPRRLVYVVNRRTVVDQATREAEQLRKKLAKAGLSDALKDLCAVPADPPLAISTLRGEFADNREWSADPSRPAIIVGTVDMIGSRLLFRGYGCGFKSRPLHAGFLGQDVLLVHDEAHLEPAFQELVVNIQREQHENERAEELRWPKLRVMELTATSRGSEAVFGLSDKDQAEPEVRKRIDAKKTINLHQNEDEKKLADPAAALALKHKESGLAVLVFVRKVDDVKKIVAKLRKEKQNVQQLTGTLRGFERDRMADPRKENACPIFARFLRPPKPDEDEQWKIEPQPGTVYLVCTSAGEVGVNISADHLVCDLSTFDSVAQRFGRVNRFGDRNDTCIDVVYPKTFDDTDLDARRKKTLELLRLSDSNGSPAALGELHRKAMREGSGAGPMSTDRTEALREYILATYASQPKTLPASDILFDAWALTTVRDLPGRPAVAEYLHGVEDERQRETYVTWREEVDLFHKTRVMEQQLNELFDEFPLRPHELLRDVTWRIQDELAELAEGHEDSPVWVIDPDDTVRVRTLGQLVKKDDRKKDVENLSGRTVVLPPSIGGLTETGMLSGKEPRDPEREYDVVGRVRLTSAPPLVRLLVTRNEGVLTYKLVAPVLDLSPDFRFAVNEDEKRDGEKRHLRNAFLENRFPPMRVAYRIALRDQEEADGDIEYLVLKPESHQKVAPHKAAWPGLDEHRKGVKGFAEVICSRLGLSQEMTRAVVLAAWWHDLGKGRQVWQLGAGNRRGVKPVSKPLHGRPPENLNHFRHELGSVIDVCGDPALVVEFRTQEPWAQELTLHLIAAHHGRGRPHFPEEEANDPERPALASATVAAETPGRFARLQRQFGRWGLAYLESLIRAADALDSKRIEETPIGEKEAGEWPTSAAGFAWPARWARPEPTIRVSVDPTNPGQFFACCGLLELADRLWPGAEGWFEGRDFCIRCAGSLAELIQGVGDAKLTQLDPEDHTGSAIEIGPPFRPLRLDWWQDNRAGGKELKVWAGSMESYGIARAMQLAMRGAPFRSPGLFNVGMVVPDPGDSRKKKEPYYFDARRAPNAHSRDIGFSPNDLDMTTTAFPAVELLCLVGLQRCLPAKTDQPRVFDYYTWDHPVLPELLPAIVPGELRLPGARGYRFENWYRTGQKKHKAFRCAIPLPAGD